MTEPAETRPPIDFGIPFDDLPKIMDRVVELYGEIAGHQIWEDERYLLQQEYLSEGFKNSRYIEYRFGSALSGHSKLLLEKRAALIKIRFDSNMRREERGYQDGIQMEDRFRADINRLLEESGLGQPLPF